MAWTDLANGVISSGLKTFGEEVTYTPFAGSPFTIKGIYNEKYLEIDANGLQILTDTPNLGVRNSDFEVQPKQNDKVTIRGQDYRVNEAQKDGEASTVLLLYRL